ncbi:MAG: rhombosortase [Gammaproteobacteria bacterium]|nr:rhombosortase [Gammaproteobacteria bacterium]
MFSFFHQESSHGSIKLPWLAIVLTAIPVCGYFIFGPAPEWLVFDRNATYQGEVWRLITAHWVHSDSEHALWDIAALGILSVVLSQYSRKLLIVSLIIGMVGVDLWLWFINQTLIYYCGLSAILNTVFAVTLYMLWREHKHHMIWIVALAAVGKIIVEMSSRQAIFTQTSWPSVPEAHAVGFVIGIFVIFLVLVGKMLR